MQKSKIQIKNKEAITSLLINRNRRIPNLLTVLSLFVGRKLDLLRRCRLRISNNNLIIEQSNNFFLAQRIHNSKFIILNSSSGQALVTLLFFVLIAITVTTASIALMIINAESTEEFAHGTQAYYVAEGGAENALLRLLRDPNYLGETLPIGNGSATISVAGSNPKVITSTGSLDNFFRTIEVQVSYTNSVLTITSWKEK